MRVSLGTDGRGCDESLDMLELAKMTALVHKARGLRYDEWPTAAEALDMATHAGSLCSGHGERLGRIEPGARGDLTLFDATAPAFTPLIDPVRQLVYGAPSKHVTSVVVDGRVVLDHGRVAHIDETEILGRAREIASRISRGGEGTAASRALEAVVRKVYDRAEAADVGLDAYVGSGLTAEGLRR